MKRDEALSLLANIAEKKDVKEADALYQSLRKPKDLIEEQLRNYLDGYAIPTLRGLAKSPKPMPFEMQVSLFAFPIEISWDEWMSYFPDGIVETREDRQNGETLLIGMPPSVEWALERKAGTFYSLNGFFSTPTASHVTVRSNDNVKRYNAFWADFDGGPEKKMEMLAKIVELPLTPSFLVETRNGFHIIYLLHEEQVDPKRWQTVQEGLIEYTDSDRACKNPSRTLRMPSSWHCKGLWEDPPKEAFKVSLIWKGGARFHLEDLEEFYMPKPKKTYQPRYFSQQGEREIKIPEPSALPKGTRHISLLEEAGRLYTRLNSSRAAEARDLLKRWYAMASEDLKPNYEKEVDDICDFVERREFGTIISR